MEGDPEYITKSPTYNEAIEVWVSLHTPQKIYKINEKISGTTHDNLFKHVPIKNGISRDLIQSAIIPGPPNPYYNKLKITFGEYAQVYIGTTNSTKYIAVGEIALITANKRGGY